MAAGDLFHHNVQPDDTDSMLVIHDVNYGDPDQSDADDDQDTDHLARLADPVVLAKVTQLDAEHERFAPRSD